MTEIKYCEGCGVPLQTNEPKKTGYIPSSALEKEPYICRRCFRIKNYNEVIPIEIDENEFVQILNQVGKTDSIVVQVVDLFDIDGTFIDGLPRFIGNNPFIMVANKIDLFPKSVIHDKIKNWLQKYAKEHGLYPEEIFLISAEKKIGLDPVIQYLQQWNGKKDIYVVGATNVGKSSFINQMIRHLGEKQVSLTTSRFPGTTLNAVHIPMKKNRNMIDTPGIVNKNRFNEWVSPETLKLITPKKTVKPKVFQLYEEQTLFIGGLARIDKKGQTDNSLVCHFSNEIEIHRTKTTNAEELYQNHLGELLSPPSKEEAEQLPKWVKHQFTIPAGQKVDIVVSGLGWIAISGDRTSVDVYAPKGIGIHLRDALV